MEGLNISKQKTWYMAPGKMQSLPVDYSQIQTPQPQHIPTVGSKVCGVHTWHHL